MVSSEVERGVRFHETTGLEAREAEAIARTVQLRVLRWFARGGRLAPATAANMPSTRRRRVGQGTGGFSVDGSLLIEGHDRPGLERLHVPTSTGALTSPRLAWSIGAPEPDVHGQQELCLTPLELLDRLTRLVPPVRGNEPKPSSKERPGLHQGEPGLSSCDAVLVALLSLLRRSHELQVVR